MVKNQVKNGADNRAKIVFYSFLLFCCMFMYMYY